MPYINFQHNWNRKLDNSIFSTIRSYNEEKEKFYKRNIGEIFDVYLNNRCVSRAKLKYVITETLLGLPYYFILLDTGLEDYNTALSIFERFKINSEDKVIVLMFKNEKEV